MFSAGCVDGAEWPCLYNPMPPMNASRFVVETRPALSPRSGGFDEYQRVCYGDKACLVSTIQCIRWKPAGFVVETRPALSPRSECFDECQAGLLWRQGMPCLYKTVCSFYAGRCPALSAARPLALEGVCLIYLVEGKFFFSSGILIHQLAGGELRHRVGFGHVSTHCHDVYLREGGLDE